MFAQLGYDVIAISGKREQEGFLKTIGAQRIIPRDEFLRDRAPLASPVFAGALDNVGGVYFDRLGAKIQPDGKLPVAGMAVGAEVTTTVLPLILRSIDILGINVSRQLNMKQPSIGAWRRCAASDCRRRSRGSSSMTTPSASSACDQSAPQPIRMDGDAGRNHQSEIRLARAVGSEDDESDASTNGHGRRFVPR